MKPFIASSCIVILIVTSQLMRTSMAQNAPTNRPSTSSLPADVQPLLLRMTTAGQSFQQQMGSPQDLLIAEKRQAKAATVLPLLKDMQADLDELHRLHPELILDQIPAVQGADTLNPAMLCLFGDTTMQGTLERAAAGDDAAAAKAAATLALADFWRTGADPVEQTKVLDRLSVLAAKNPNDRSVTTVALMMPAFGSASDQSKAKLGEILASLKGSATADAAVRVTNESEETKRLRSLEDKPLLIEGTRLDGVRFSSAEMKGRVILVVFWATWCAPCVAEIPRVQTVYSTFHEKGFEVVGVSSDFARPGLDRFLDQRKEMAWPQLWDANAASQEKLNPVASNLGIVGIPVMMLIDRQGICRSVTPEANLESLVGGLVAEKQN